MASCVVGGPLCLPSQPADRQAQPHIYWPNMLGAVWEEWWQWESLNEGFELIYNASDEDDEEDAMGAHNNDGRTRRCLVVLFLLLLMLMLLADFRLKI